MSWRPWRNGLCPLSGAADVWSIDTRPDQTRQLPSMSHLILPLPVPVPVPVPVCAWSTGWSCLHRLRSNLSRLHCQDSIPIPLPSEPLIFIANPRPHLEPPPSHPEINSSSALSTTFDPALTPTSHCQASPLRLALPAGRCGLVWSCRCLCGVYPSISPQQLTSWPHLEP